MEEEQHIEHEVSNVHSDEKAKRSNNSGNEYEKNKLIEEQEWVDFWNKKKEFLSVEKYEQLT